MPQVSEFYWSFILLKFYLMFILITMFLTYLHSFSQKISTVGIKFFYSI